MPGRGAGNFDDVIETEESPYSQDGEGEEPE